MLKIATFNINGIRSRLPILLEWLEREGPDIVCLQELKAPDAAFPMTEIQTAGYGAIWHGQVSWNGVAILAKGIDPLERRRGLPGSEADTPQPLPRSCDPRHDRRLPISAERQPATWSQIRLQTGLVRTADQVRRRPSRKRPSGSACRRLQRCANRQRYLQSAFLVEGCAATTRKPRVLSAPAHRDGPILCALAIQRTASTPSGTISGSIGKRIRDCASIICCSMPNWRLGCDMPASIVGSATNPMPATTRRPGLSWIWFRRRDPAWHISTRFRNVCHGRDAHGASARSGQHVR